LGEAKGWTAVLAGRVQALSRAGSGPVQ